MHMFIEKKTFQAGVGLSWRNDDSYYCRRCGGFCLGLYAAILLPNEAQRNTLADVSDEDVGIRNNPNNLFAFQHS